MAALGLAPALGTSRAPASAADVARHVGALQAQDYQSGVWSLGARSGLTLAQVEQAILDREVVRTWPMRGTIHFVPAEDARWMSRLLAGRPLAALGARYRQLGITDSEIRLAGSLFEKHLTEPMSRPDVIELLTAHGIDPSEQRAYHLVGHHCMTGLLCQGPMAGRQPTFVLIDAWVAMSRTPDDEEGMAEIVERYVRSHGPVTEKDVAGWLAHPLGITREALTQLGDRLFREDVDGQTWLTHVDAPPPPTRGGLHLLPQWDELLLGYKSRDVSLPARHLDRVVPGRNMQFQPTVVADGEVIGTWRRRQTAAATLIDVDLFDPATPTRWSGIERAAAAYGRFLGRPVEVRDLAGRQ